MDYQLFGLTKEELSETLGVIPPLQYWGYSRVSLDYCDYKAENGRMYTLYFEKDKLIGVRYEFILRNRKYKEISGADVMKARTIYGDPTNVLFLVFFSFY